MLSKKCLGENKLLFEIGEYVYICTTGSGGKKSVGTSNRAFQLCPFVTISIEAVNEIKYREGLNSLSISFSSLSLFFLVYT